MAKEKKNKKEKFQESISEEPLEKPNLIARIKGMSKKSWLIVLAVAIIIGLFLIYNNIHQNQLRAQSSLQTAIVKKGDLIAIVGATGTVNANQSADLIWQTNGRIASIDVKLNDQVQKDQVLATLDATSMAPNILSARADLVSAKKSLEDTQLSASTQANAFSQLVKDQNDLKQAKSDRDRWNYNNADWNRIYQARNVFLKADDVLSKSQRAYDLLNNLPADNVERKAAHDKYADDQLDRDKALRNLSYLLGRNYSDEVALDFGKYDVAQAAVDDDRRAWERVMDGPNKDDIAAAQAKVDAAQSTVNLGLLSAPFAGTVTEVNSKAGDLVISGMKSFRIDDLSKFIIKVDLPEIDINRVQVGQQADLTFDAVPGKKYEGVVTEFEPVGALSDGVVNFTVTIELTGVDGEVKPGMTAAVNIVVSEVKSVLIVPNRAVRLLNGVHYLNVMKNGTSTQVKVEIGASSDTETQIVSGDVKEGDTVVITSTLQIGPGSSMGTSSSSMFGR